MSVYSLEVTAAIAQSGPIMSLVVYMVKSEYEPTGRFAAGQIIGVMILGIPRNLYRLPCIRFDIPRAFRSIDRLYIDRFPKYETSSSGSMAH